MRLIAILIVATFTLLTIGCQEETPAPQPPAKPAPQEPAKTMTPQQMAEHAKQQAHERLDTVHKQVTEAHNQAQQQSSDNLEHAKDQAHQTMAKLHQDMKDAHQGVKALTNPNEEALALGKTIYAKACASCHDTGIAHSPKLGDKEAWAPRIAAGLDPMVTSVLQGKGAMPARGGNPALTEEEVRAAVSYILSMSR